MKTVTTRRQWVVPSDTAKDVDRLSFIGRDANDRPIWWNPEHLRTRYCHPHEALGRAYAFELLDCINANKGVDDEDEHLFGRIAYHIVRAGSATNESVVMGFFNVFSEYIATGKVNR